MIEEMKCNIRKRKRYLHFIPPWKDLANLGFMSNIKIDPLLIRISNYKNIMLGQLNGT